MHRWRRLRLPSNATRVLFCSLTAVLRVPTDAVSSTQQPLSPLSSSSSPSVNKKRLVRRRRPSAASAGAEADPPDVERLLSSAVNTTAAALSTRQSPCRRAREGPDNGADGSSRLVVSAQPPPSVSGSLRPRGEPPAELTRRSLDAGETVTSGAAHASREQVVRRRRKATVVDAEFDVGITERLLPEIRRLPALHELHFGDAVVREVDSATYFDRLRDATAGEGTAARVDGARMELPVDDDLDFDLFDAEAAEDPAQESAAAAEVVASSAVEPGSAAETSPEGSAHAPLLSENAETAPAVARTTQRPWFASLLESDGGAVRLAPLSPADCLLLLRFVLQLRNHGLDDLSPAIKRKVHAVNGGAGKRGERERKGRDSVTRTHATKSQLADVLTLADVIQYLDTAPAPIIGLTENLCDPVTKAPRVQSPAFLFTLYMENVSLQNALAHLAALFGIPIQSFRTHSAPSKMSCAAILCAVEKNRLRREHLLLINTMRLPGFVLRTGSIHELPDGASPSPQATRKGSADVSPAHSHSDRAAGGVAATASPSSDVSSADSIFGELSRWDPLFECQLILRRVGGARTGKRELERRLHAMETVGAVFYTATREPSLARAATDVLHGFYKSAVINALQRRCAPLAMRRFLERPNAVTAARARAASTDAVVRQTLKAFIATNGDWQATVQRTPYTWRRRWLNALRSQVWNHMAARRVRVGGREVMVGDVVVRELYRDDVQRRALTTLKSEHVKLVETAEEAASCTLEDVVLPFLRGRLPDSLLAPPASSHPIMTADNMLALLRDLHAPQLLLGMPEEARRILDVRADTAPLLWRRLIFRPVAMQYAVLEDKAPLRSTQFDAARLLSNDRLCGALGSVLRLHAGDGVDAEENGTVSASGRHGPSPPAPSTAGAAAAAAAFPTAGTSLVPRSVLLEHTAIGARVTSGFSAEDFFDVPSADNYVVLGQSKRMLAGAFVPARPATPEAELGDRVYSIYIKAITRTGAAGLTQLLREYFLLAGVEAESDSVLQHKVHRTRRELDPETPWMTAPTFCAVCYNRDHDHRDACAEYYFKLNKHRSAQLIESALRLHQRHSLHPSAFGAPLGVPPPDSRPLRGETGGHHVVPASLASGAAGRAFTVVLTLTLRRGQQQNWGVNLTTSLRLTGLDDASLVHHGEVRIAPAALPSLQSPTAVAAAAVDADAPRADELLHSWPPHVLLEVRKLQLLHEPAELLARDSQPVGAVSALLSILLPAETLQSMVTAASPPANLPLQRRASSDMVGTALAARVPGTDGSLRPNRLLRSCGWRLVQVDEQPVSCRRDVAAVFVQRTKHTEVTMSFAATLQLDSPPALADSAPVHTPSAMPAYPQPMRTVQRVLQSLPDTLSLVLSKTRAHATSAEPSVASWGVRLHVKDMTLISLSQLLLSALGSTDAVQKTDAPTVDVLVSPAETVDALRTLFPLAHGSAEQDAARTVLDAMYAITRINNAVVASPQAAADALRAFRQRITAQHSGDALDRVHLSLSLARRAGSGRLIAALTLPATGPSKEDVHAPTAAEDSPTPHADSAPPVAASQPPQPPQPSGSSLTPAQLRQSVMTIAINRLVLNAETLGKWGVKVQRETRRLKYVQFNRLYHSQIFAAKPNQAVRAQDSLRLLLPTSHCYPHREDAGHGEQRRAVDSSTIVVSPDDGSHTLAAAAPGLRQAFSHYAYFIVAVNDAAVGSFSELRDALHRAALPAAFAPAPEASADSAEELRQLRRGPESVTLRVKQYRLPSVRVRVLRGGGAGEPSPLAPVGLSVNHSLVALAVEPDSPMAAGVLAAADAESSIRRLIRRDAGGASTAGSARTSSVVVSAALSRALEAVLTAADNPTQPSTRIAAAQQKRAWQYNVDEDAAMEEEGGSSSSSSGNGLEGSLAQSGAAGARSSQVEQAMSALEQLGTVAAEQQAAMDAAACVDAVHLLQVSVISSFVESHRPRAPRRAGAASLESASSLTALRDGLTGLLARLEAAAADEVCWRVRYAVKANAALHTTEDLSRVLAPGVADETIVFQQCLIGK